MTAELELRQRFVTNQLVDISQTPVSKHFSLLCTLMIFIYHSSFCNVGTICFQNTRSPYWLVSHHPATNQPYSQSPVLRPRRNTIPEHASGLSEYTQERLECSSQKTHPKHTALYTQILELHVH